MGSSGRNGAEEREVATCAASHRGPRLAR